MLINPFDFINAALSSDVAAWLFVGAFYLTLGALVIGLPTLMIAFIMVSFWRDYK